MKSLTELAIPIYQSLSEKYPNPTERTKEYILNEITQWSIKRVSTPEFYAFKPVEFEGNQDSKPFEVRLIRKDNNFWELKFGNLNAPTVQGMYKWDDDDPYKLQKALFLSSVINKEIVPLLDSGKILGIQFYPYDGDGFGRDRYSYFYNMYTKLGKSKYSLDRNTDGIYTITKK